MPQADEIQAYLAEVVARLDAVLGGGLVGVYAGGSLALGGYVPGRSDIDLAAVSGHPLSEPEKRQLVAALRYEALPCPARGLELAVYPESTVRAPTGEPGFELNLNSGRGLPFRADFEPDVPDRHWFAIDRSILGRHGLVLRGPPVSELFAPIPKDVLLPLLVASVRWEEAGCEDASAAVLNACRALRFAQEGVWSTKAAAGRWALGRIEDDRVVACALGPAQPDPVAAPAFLRQAGDRIVGAMGGQQNDPVSIS